jgi:hypothetical protein
MIMLRGKGGVMKIEGFPSIKAVSVKMCYWKNNKISADFRAHSDEDLEKAIKSQHPYFRSLLKDRPIVYYKLAEAEVEYKNGITLRGIDVFGFEGKTWTGKGRHLKENQFGFSEAICLETNNAVLSAYHLALEEANAARAAC